MQAKHLESFKQYRESTKGTSRWKVEYRHGKFEESGLNNWSISKSQKGDGTWCPEGSVYPVGMPHCKCFMETTYNSMKVKLGIKVMNLVESLIGLEVHVGQGWERHLKIKCECIGVYVTCNDISVIYSPDQSKV